MKTFTTSMLLAFAPALVLGQSGTYMVEWHAVSNDCIGNASFNITLEGNSDCVSIENDVNDTGSIRIIPMGSGGATTPTMYEDGECALTALRMAERADDPGCWNLINPGGNDVQSFTIAQEGA